jgi:hypothetical protein
MEAWRMIRALFFHDLAYEFVPKLQTLPAQAVLVSAGDSQSQVFLSQTITVPLVFREEPTADHLQPSYGASPDILPGISARGIPAGFSIATASTTVPAPTPDEAGCRLE